MPRNPLLTTQIVVRIDGDLRAAVEADAVANGRTVAQTVRFHLRHALLAAPTEDPDHE